MEIKRKARSSGASCDGVSICLYLALLASFASPSYSIKLNGYDFNNSVSTKIFSLDQSTNCDNKIRESETKEKGSLIYTEVQPEIKLKFRIYNIGTLKSNLYDDAVFVTKNSRLLKSIHPINEGICRYLWQNKNFDVPGFGDRTFKVNRSVTEKILRLARETIYVEEHSQNFMAKNGRKSALYAEPVE